MTLPRSLREMLAWLVTVWLVSALLVPTACRNEAQMEQSDSTRNGLYQQRLEMVETQIERRGVRDSWVLDAMRTVPRHEFVPEDYRDRAYDDGPLPIGWDQTISQPYIVAIMTELLQIDSTSRVLEVGTGSGYQAAVLAEIAAEVYTIEIVEPLCHRADSVLSALKYDSVHVRCGDGYQGWSEVAPFDGIIVTAAPDHVPQPLIDQLAVGGNLVIPVGTYYQELRRITKTESGVTERSVIPVRFVPMTGEAEER
jgi:protein-L-isoaspartate(D-aspartate) O-methyltransferase